MSAVEELIRVLDLEPIEVNLFRGFTPRESRQRIFGGQVVAQALLAAYKTVEARHCHSLQSYFIRPGDPKLPVLYQVERSRDGHSFATRRVIAIQKGEQIFNLACSFQTPEAGLEHQGTMPEAPPPEQVADERERLAERFAGAPEDIRQQMLRDRPIEMRPCDPVGFLTPVRRPPFENIWFRSRADFGDDVALNQAALAYASDMSLLSTSMRPHGVTWASGKVQSASLDHCVWFHRPTRFSEWHLYAQDSPSASGARGFNRGAVYRADGVLVASVAQEGLIRLRG